MRFSFLGLGNMGTPLAANILASGEKLAIYTRRPEHAASFAAKGAQVAEKISDLAQCDVLCTCLPMPEDVVNAAIGRHNLYGLMPPGSIHLEFSTIDPATAQKLASAAKEKGIGYVQATVSKSPQVAAEGNAPLFVGGDADAIARVMPILVKIAKPRDLKTIEAACGVKLLSNLVGMANVAILAEGMRLGKLAGMDAHELLELLLDTGAASHQLKMRGQMIADNDFAARFGVDLAAKDLRLGCAMARELGYEPRMMLQALACFQKAHAAGLGGEDVCALYKLPDD